MIDQVTMPTIIFPYSVQYNFFIEAFGNPKIDTHASISMAYTMSLSCLPQTFFNTIPTLSFLPPPGGDPSLFLKFSPHCVYTSFPILIFVPIIPHFTFNLARGYYNYRHYYSNLYKLGIKLG